MADRVGQQLGNYRLLRELGQGAFAEVYLGEHQYLERPAAIKVLHIRMDTETQEQFRREARTIAHLHHPHIVQVLDFGIQDQTPYLVMEYTPGGTLRSQHPKGTRLPVGQIVTYVKQIASALDYAHQHRVIHRDVKPDNLLLNANYEAVLSDFGIAVVQHSLDSLSMSNPAAGTPLYMAPEQIQQQPCTASDQYALGIMVYEWLTGEAPFRGSTVFEVFSHHLYQAPPSLRELLLDLPVAVEEAIFKALAKDPEQRFARVTDFALALEEACDATQQLTLPGLPDQQRIHAPTVSYSTKFVSAATARDQEGSSSSTQPVPMIMQGTERGEEVVLSRDPGPSQHRLAGSKRVKPSLAHSNRQRFLQRVRTLWIDGVLDHSLHGATLIALGLQEQLDALANPWHLILHHPDTIPRSFPVGTRISEVYDAVNEELLILGAPGSGKTTLLLELTRDLLERAEQDEQHLMPVVFPLSSWAAKQQPLSVWMIEELINKYQVPRQLAHTWIDEDQILPLLDGLDEVVTESRTTCIETINTYHQEHTFLPLVVSSRSADYVQQTGRVRLSSAITIQSLTQQQVDDYLARRGEAVWALRVALHQDAALRELAETPLMLSILTLTYHDMPVEDLLKGGIAPTRPQIFERYVNRMLVQRSSSTQHPREQTNGWLSWLAKHLVQRGQTVFYLEQLQPNWLSSSRLLGWYDLLAVKVPSVLIGILVTVVINAFLYDLFSPYILLGGLVGWILSEESPPQRTGANSGKVRRISWQRLFQQLLIGLLIGLGLVLRGAPDNDFRHYFKPSDPLFLLFILLFGFYSFLLQVFLAKSNNIPSLSQTRSQGGRTKWQRLIRSPALYNGLFAGLGIGLIDYPLDGLSVGLSVVFLSQLLIGKSRTIQVTDRLIWSWSHLGQSLRSSQHIRATLQIIVLVVLLLELLLGLLFVESIGQGTGQSYTLSYILIIEPSVGLVVGLIYWLIIGLFQGVSSEIIEDQRRMTPNQGIHLSALNALVLGGISAIISGLILSLIVLLIERFFVQPTTGQGDWLIAGLSAGLLAGLLNGGLASWRHYILRFLLWREKSMPWNYPRFLDYAAEHILLRKVGGGYIFVHRLLLEYFASLGTTSSPDATRAKKRQT